MTVRDADPNISFRCTLSGKTIAGKDVRDEDVCAGGTTTGWANRVTDQETDARQKADAFAVKPVAEYLPNASGPIPSTVEPKDPGIGQTEPAIYALAQVLGANLDPLTGLNPNSPTFTTDAPTAVTTSGNNVRGTADAQAPNDGTPTLTEIQRNWPLVVASTRDKEALMPGLPKPNANPDASSSATFTPDNQLLDGRYTLVVRADRSPEADQDTVEGTGGVTVAATDEVKYTWFVDNKPPSAAPAITAMPEASTRATDARFEFSSTDKNRIKDEPAGTFACSLDGAAEAACGSPHELHGLSVAQHTLQVREVDAAGNPGPLATYTWTVEPTPVVASSEPEPVLVPVKTSPPTRVVAVKGKVVVTVDGAKPVPLAPDQAVPSGAKIDASRGRLVLSAPRAGGKVQQIAIVGGPFRYTLKRDGRDRLMVIALEGTKPATVDVTGKSCNCEVLTPDARAQVDGNAHWITAKTAKGTGVKVLSGRLKVVDRRSCEPRRLPSKAKAGQASAVKRSTFVHRRKLAVRC